MRLIDADGLLEELKSLEPRCANKYVKQGIDDGLHYYMPKILEEQPTVDAVEVVRCKDCKHYWKNKNTPGYLDKCVTASDDYCSSGERKDGDGNG